MKACILIPVYNHLARLQALLATFSPPDGAGLIVVDDGSTSPIRATDLSPGTQLLRHEKNMGKGAALQKGLDAAKKAGFTHALALDADGQHDPALIPEFFALAEAHTGALILGRRPFVLGQMPFMRILSNRLTSAMLSWRTGQRIHDSQVGYRMYPLADSRLWALKTGGFQFESALFFKTAELGIALHWVQIPVIYAGESSHMRPAHDILAFIKLLIRKSV